MFCSFTRINSTDNCASAERAEPTRSLFKCPPGEHFLTQPGLPCAHQVHIWMRRSNINSSSKYKRPNPGGHSVGPNWFMAALIEPFLHQPLFFLTTLCSHFLLRFVLPKSAHISAARQKVTAGTDTSIISAPQLNTPWKRFATKKTAKCKPQLLISSESC